jgi:hypothetical protein
VTAKDSRLLKIGHASLEVFDDMDQAVADMHKLAALGCHTLSGTESGTSARKTRLAAALHNAGYRTFFPAQTGGWLAVKRSLVHNDWSTTYRSVIPSGNAINDPHPHDERGVVRATWRHDTLGRMTLITSHYLTLGRFPAQAREDNPNCHVDHVMWNRRLANAVSQAAIRGSERDDDRGISFVTLDANTIDRTDDVFLGKPLTTCWDELDQWPNTGHGNIDVIASVDSDARVSCEKAWAITDMDLHLATDHFPIVAQYNVRKINQRKASA